jgi:HPt (histidine-containing phosphotransfer) domain-containing protein
LENFCWALQRARSSVEFSSKNCVMARKDLEMTRTAVDSYPAPQPRKLENVIVSPLDFVHLATQTGGDLFLQRDLLDLFLIQAAEFAACLPELAKADPAAAADLAHKLDGSARTIGAFELAGRAAEFERMLARGGEFAAAEPLAHALDGVVRAVKSYLCELAPRLGV